MLSEYSKLRRRFSACTFFGGICSTIILQFIKTCKVTAVRRCRCLLFH